MFCVDSWTSNYHLHVVFPSKSRFIPKLSYDIACSFHSSKMMFNMIRWAFSFEFLKYDTRHPIERACFKSVVRSISNFHLICNNFQQHTLYGFWPPKLIVCPWIRFFCPYRIWKSHPIHNQKLRNSLQNKDNISPLSKQTKLHLIALSVTFHTHVIRYRLCVVKKSVWTSHNEVC